MCERRLTRRRVLTGTGAAGIGAISTRAAAERPDTHVVVTATDTDGATGSDSRSI